MVTDSLVHYLFLVMQLAYFMVVHLTCKLTEVAGIYYECRAAARVK